MITSDAGTLQRYRSASDGGEPVSVRLGLGRYADEYRGFRIRRYSWQGSGPAGQWFWQAQSDTALIGETVLYSGPESEVLDQIAEDAAHAIDCQQAAPAE